jgi:hypothetical protein
VGLVGVHRAAGGVRLDLTAAPGASAAAVRDAALVPLAVRATADGLEVDGAPPLLVWVGGAVLVVTDDDLDPAPPESAAEPLRVVGGCAAAPIRGNLGALALSVAGVGARRRRGGRGDRVAARGV